MDPADARLLDRLGEMARVQLGVLWQERFGQPLPGAVPDRLARLALAHAIQSGSRTPLSPGRGARSPGAPPRTARAARTVSVRPGTVLVRDWHGTTHRVEVTGPGRSRWDGRDWRSLSAIARAITGTPRSGPAFFGLRERAPG